MLRLECWKLAKRQLKFATSIENDNNNKYDIRKEMLEEYKQIRLTHEEYVKQLKRANDLKEEKNRLLKEIFLQNKNVNI